MISRFPVYVHCVYAHCVVILSHQKTDLTEVNGGVDIVEVIIEFDWKRFFFGPDDENVNYISQVKKSIYYHQS